MTFVMLAIGIGRCSSPAARRPSNPTAPTANVPKPGRLSAWGAAATGGGSVMAGCAAGMGAPSAFAE